MTCGKRYEDKGNMIQEGDDRRDQLVGEDGRKDFWSRCERCGITDISTDFSKGEMGEFSSQAIRAALRVFG